MGLPSPGSLQRKPLSIHEIQYKMIKHLNRDSMIKLLEMYNEIWKRQIFPNSWHFAHINPILKGGGYPRSAISYCPIALTSCLFKVTDRIVNRRLLHFLNSRKLLVDKEHLTLDYLIKLDNPSRQLAKCTFSFLSNGIPIWHRKL